MGGGSVDAEKKIENNDIYKYKKNAFFHPTNVFFLRPYMYDKLDNLCLDLGGGCLLIVSDNL
jgi:hypothetical protein